MGGEPLGRLYSDDERDGFDSAAGETVSGNGDGGARPKLVMGWVRSAPCEYGCEYDAGLSQCGCPPMSSNPANSSLGCPVNGLRVQSKFVSTMGPSMERVDCSWLLCEDGHDEGKYVA